MSAYLTEPWHDFFVAEVGASAALTGLLFVAASINLEHILSYEGLPERAAETLVVLVNVLIVASFGLVPDQRIALLGWEILVTSGLVWAGVVAAKLRAPAAGAPVAPGVLPQRRLGPGGRHPVPRLRRQPDRGLGRWAVLARAGRGVLVRGGGEQRLGADGRDPPLSASGVHDGTQPAAADALEFELPAIFEDQS